MMNSLFIETLKNRVLLCDGGMGTLIQGEIFDVEKDFLGHENCLEMLNLGRPNFVKDLHRAYLKVGADCVETNTFGANKVVLSDFDIAEKAYELSLEGAKLAREVADEFSTKDQPRFVVGSMGPGTKLPSLGQITYDELFESYLEQARGLLDGKADLLLLETNQDLLTIKAAIHACRMAKQEREDNLTPIFVQVTMESTGTMLVGSDMACVVTTLQAMGVDGLGLNCGTGPAEMIEHVQYLAQHWPGFISVMPNAGLPILVDGQTTYPLSPDALAEQEKRFVENFSANLIGGCCGTRPAHIAALRKMLDNRKQRAPIKRKCVLIPAVSSLFSSVSFQQENAVFSIGERTNANGSKKFRDLLKEEDWNGMLALAKDQVKAGSHALDICTALVGHDEKQDMQTFLSYCRGQVNSPLVIDSTDVNVIQAGLKLLGGKSIINSINFEAGEEKAAHILKLAKQFGAAVIALTIDEQGMAKSVEDKISIAKRLYDFAVNQCHLSPHDLLIDPLTFTICTGAQEDRELGMNTLKAIEEISKQLPNCQVILGLSNVSFGLKAAARHVLNSVFLHHAEQRGLTAAIIHVSKIMPLFKIPEVLREAAENLIFNRWENNQDPLLHFIKLFENIEEKTEEIEKVLTIEEKIKTHIIDGNKQNLEQDLINALKQYSPLDIINHLLLEAMKTVGELFGSGEMQLPFVLQSAETMKTAVDYLTPLIEKDKTHQKGVLVLATVQGDVHDIGKNLVDMILTNNGYKVINLGIKQSIDEIVAAAKEYNADAVGLSGLLVKSTVIMKENLEEMRRQGLTIPAILGGAALTAHYVETECQCAYGEAARVYYAKDAFSGLQLMDQIIAGRE